ncbi:HAUS augmin-like complex subunit 2 isoform X1 [Mastomys coucha]|uniref:HAUS augmin-like complex subunit 2 isoform X1 n=1 Tax=Mastomys coucha TaxID=35658 RepID=UPI001261EBCE|nr:HAUS augmin-like complex subunit 2 isoform X1 [Mastomys coucha]
MAAANPWDPASAQSAAGLLLNRLVASGIVTEEMLDISRKMAPCFVNFSRLQQISDIQAEIYQNNLEIELLKLEKDTADLIHPSYLVEKCDVLQNMNNHLETVLKEKQTIRQRLLRPQCQDNLPLEAVYHRYMVHMLDLAVIFIEKLETHLETVRNSPHLDANLQKVSKALAKMDILVNKTEELAENILKWREQQTEISLYIPKMLTEESHLHELDIVSPLPFFSKTHTETSNAK